MRITGTPSCIWIEINGKTIKAMGELTITPAFYANKNSMNHWERPYEDEVIDEKTREWIINSVMEYTKDLEFKIYFD
jgi:hypothetical protein